MADLNRSARTRRYGSLDASAQEGLDETALEDEEQDQEGGYDCDGGSRDHRYVDAILGRGED